MGLRACKQAPNCFSTTPDVAVFQGGRVDDHLIAPWRFPATLGRAAAFDALVAIVRAYPPGQGGIDGGGFKVVESNAAKGYLYAQVG